MANVAFSDLSALTDIATGDLLMVTDVSEAGAEQSKKITIANFMKGAGKFSDSRRAQILYSDKDTVTIRAGRYLHIGTITQMVYWNSALTYDFTGLSGSEIHYLYIDDSAVVTADTNLLTKTEFTNSTTAPSWSNATKGWYNGDDRCIFAVMCSGGEIMPFDHSTNLVTFRSVHTSRALADLGTSWTAVALKAPGFCDEALVTFENYHAGTGRSIYGYWRNTSGDGHLAWATRSQYERDVNTVRVSCDSSQEIDIKNNDATGDQQVAVYTDGFFLPRDI